MNKPFRNLSKSLLVGSLLLGISCARDKQELSPATDRKPADPIHLEEAFPGTAAEGNPVSGFYQGVEVSYSKKNGKAVIMGDIVVDLSEISDENPTKEKGARTSGTYIRTIEKVWDKNTIYYLIDASVPTVNRTKILDAISHWQSNTQLKFIQRTNQPDYVRFLYNLESSGDYSSAIGRKGGEQIIHLSLASTTGTAIHEIGHAVGLFHESSREDRSSYIYVNTAEILPGKESNFYTYGGQGYKGADWYGGLDFGSIMMLDSYAFAKGSQPTLIKLDGSTFSAQRNGLSVYDRCAAHVGYPHLINGVGDEGNGAGVALGDINRNGITDAVFMANDNPSGGNYFKYYVAFDLNANGQPSYVSGMRSTPALGGLAEGSDIALADIDRNGILDMVLLHYDAPSGSNEFRYKIGFNLNTSGDPVSWGGQVSVAGVGGVGDGAGVALADIDRNGTPDMVLMAYDDPSGANTFRYKVGFNLSSSGSASYWGNAITVSGVGEEAQGAAVALADLNRDNTLDIVLMAYDDQPPVSDNAHNEFRYRIGYSLNTGGVAASWSASSYYPAIGVGHHGQGAGIAIGDIDRNGVPDMILMAYDNPAGGNTFKYRVGYNIGSPLPHWTHDWR